jgi:hypothetical protein
MTARDHCHLGGRGTRTPSSTGGSIGLRHDLHAEDERTSHALAGHVVDLPVSLVTVPTEIHRLLYVTHS